MRKITYLITALLLSFALNAQNLINYWNGYNPSTATYVTGEGSQAKYWGWSTKPVASSIRYMDNVTGYDAGRIMYIRWDGVVSTAGKYYLKLDSINTDHLIGGHSYTFTWSYAWNSNASAPTITTTICSAKDGTGVVSALAVTGTNAAISGTSETFPCNATSKSMRTGSITFMPPTDGDYYISFASDKAALCAIRDLSLVDYGDKYAGLIELQKQADALTLGDLNEVSSNLTLPTTAGTQGVKIKWTSSNPSIIDSLGHVVQPAQYNQTVKLTATLSLNFADTIYTRTKSFVAYVTGIIPTPLEIAQWDFDATLVHETDGVITVADQKSGFVGTCMNEAKIRTIGTTEKYNVLDLGNGKGYFDMGTEIGKAVYSLTNYTMCGFFRIDDTYAQLNNNGNFYWTFSNTADADKDKNGYIIGSLKAQSQSVADYYNINNQATGSGVNATKGGWHHFAYVQNGNTGTTYIDGAQSSQNTAMTNLPALLLPKAGLTGTAYNWLGRSNYINDVYLRNTLLYDFRLLSVSLTAEDLSFQVLTVPQTIDALNTAYTENPDYVLPELATEMNNLNMGDLSAVTSNITLPTKGTLDNTISISWKTKTPSLVSYSGVVTRPNYYNYKDTLTATFSKSGQKLTKAFPLTVLAKEGTAYSNDLLVKYDFASVADSIVTDAAEKHLTGVLKNQAKVQSIGKTVKYNVLNLGDSIGYFDMGPEVGKLMYNLNDYTMSAYYRIDSTYANITKAGNFLWSLSNTNAAMTAQTGYVIGALNNQSVSITPGYYTAASGNQAVSLGSVALTNGWHNLAYTQSGTTGTIYVDGMPVATGTITAFPSTALPKAGNLGTLYNWLGRSCYASDSYLRKTLVYDFRIYSKALTDAEIQTSVLNVGNTISALDVAYRETPTALKNIANSQFSVIPSAGSIRINGLSNADKVALFDITGRQLLISNPELIKTNAGVYIVKINNFVTKVVVK
jgi:hypothetical protein